MKKRALSLVFIGCVMFLMTGCRNTDDVVLKEAYSQLKSDKIVINKKDIPVKQQERMMWNINVEKREQILTLAKTLVKICESASFSVGDGNFTISEDAANIALPDSRYIDSGLVESPILNLQAELSEKQAAAFALELEKLGYTNSKQLTTSEEYISFTDQGLTFELEGKRLYVFCSYGNLYNNPLFSSVFDNTLTDGFRISGLHTGGPVDMLALTGEINDFYNDDIFRYNNMNLYMKDDSLIQLEMVFCRNMGDKNNDMTWTEKEKSTVTRCLESLTGDRTAAEKFVQEFSFDGANKGSIGGRSWELKSSRDMYTEYYKVIIQ